MNLIPVVVDKERFGERSYDIFSRLLKERIIFLSGEIDDDTFERFQELITVPILFVKYKDAEKCLRGIIDYKIIYNKIKTTSIKEIW